MGVDGNERQAWAGDVRRMKMGQLMRGTMYSDLEWLLSNRTFYLKWLSVSVAVTSILGIAAWGTGVFTTPEATSTGELILAYLVGSSFGFVIIFVTLLFYNFGKVEKLRRKIRTWEWQNGQ